MAPVARQYCNATPEPDGLVSLYFLCVQPCGVLMKRVHGHLG